MGGGSVGQPGPLQRARVHVGLGAGVLVALMDLLAFRRGCGDHVECWWIVDIRLHALFGDPGSTTGAPVDPGASAGVVILGLGVFLHPGDGGQAIGLLHLGLGWLPGQLAGRLPERLGGLRWLLGRHRCAHVAGGMKGDHLGAYGGDLLLHGRVLGVLGVLPGHLPGRLGGTGWLSGQLAGRLPGQLPVSSGFMGGPDGPPRLLHSFLFDTPRIRVRFVVSPPFLHLLLWVLLQLLGFLGVLEHIRGVTVGDQVWDLPLLLHHLVSGSGVLDVELLGNRFSDEGRPSLLGLLRHCTGAGGLLPGLVKLEALGNLYSPYVG